MTAEQQQAQYREAAEFETGREYRCPDCGGPCLFMGQDFKAPKRTDTKAWSKVQAYIEAGNIYYRRKSN